MKRTDPSTAEKWSYMVIADPTDTPWPTFEEARATKMPKELDKRVAARKLRDQGWHYAKIAERINLLYHTKHNRQTIQRWLDPAYAKMQKESLRCYRQRCKNS
jgi:hypothetical protein